MMFHTGLVKYYICPNASINMAENRKENAMTNKEEKKVNEK
jgi:hypothetical protein